MDAEADGMRYDALALSWAGDKFLGRPYSEMDCQAFVERCLREIGIALDLRGSNAWYRKCKEEGWTGTPEDCVRVFGSVPKGAFLFIWDDKGGEVKRGYTDGLGDATHIGIKTGRGKGAIHSSSSRGCVADSEFRDKTIRGGWNRVGLWRQLDYGKTVNWVLEHMGTEKPQEEEKTMTVTVKSPNGRPVNLRKAPTTSAALVDRIADGTEAELLEGGDEWSKIKAHGRIGWMKAEFLETGKDPGEESGREDGGQIQLAFTAAELGTLLPILESAVDQIVAKVGRG